ncbi:Protein FAM160B2 [Eumeta japonica]|uniref:Protein FAM160B2 n=1 Tax=Eumeta variegata TaxID=151549 RepID=A0A4C1Z817_EUMVA|nr:Protein FAM160B2 [Eumeta japonica]
MLANIYSIPIQAWLDITSNFNWPTEYHYVDTAASSTTATTAGRSRHTPRRMFVPKEANKECKHMLYRLRKLQSNMQFLSKLVFKHQDDKTMSKMEEELTSIISKLAMLPHPYLHEYLLNPMLSTSKKTRTLFKTLQELAHKLTIEIPRIKNYKRVIENVRLQLMSEDPSYDEKDDHNQLVESLIVVEEFCKELAAIAFVKYQHSVQVNR